jgi:hypothetical protein
MGHTVHAHSTPFTPSAHSSHCGPSSRHPHTLLTAALFTPSAHSSHCGPLHAIRALFSLRPLFTPSAHSSHCGPSSRHPRTLLTAALFTPSAHSSHCGPCSRHPRTLLTAAPLHAIRTLFSLRTVACVRACTGMAMIVLAHGSHLCPRLTSPPTAHMLPHMEIRPRTPHFIHCMRVVMLLTCAAL